MSLSVLQKERFARNLLVDKFSDQQQLLLIKARVAVVGAGGLGSVLLSYLVAAGVGHITIVESDTISLSNLQRQILYSTSDLGESKAEMAAIRLSRLYPECEIHTLTDRLTSDNAHRALADHDLVVDCTDNYETRYVIDDFCKATRTPMVYATAEQIGGQVSVFHTPRSGSYRALYPQAAKQKEVVGVLSPIVGVIGSIQALECVKLLCGTGSSLEGYLLVVDGESLQFQRFAIAV